MTRTIVPQWEFKDRLAKALDVSDYGVGEMAAECEAQRLNAGTTFAATFVRLRGGVWRVVMTPEQWFTYQREVMA